jgi:hypothetical protein
MYKGHIYSKDDVRSPFVKPPWLADGKSTNFYLMIGVCTALPQFLFV